MNYSRGACQPPSSSSAGAGLTGWPTNWTRAEELNCREAVRAFGSGNTGDGSELDFLSFAGIGSSLSVSGTGLFAFRSNVGVGEAFEPPSIAGATTLDEDATLHDEHPDGAPYTADPQPSKPHDPQEL